MASGHVIPASCYVCGGAEAEVLLGTDARSPGSSLVRRCLVSCASIPWAFQRNRQQELAVRLSRLLPVLYVEPPAPGGRAARDAAASLWSPCPGCHVLPSVRGLRGDRALSVVNRIVQRRVVQALDIALKRLEAECVVLWVDRILSADLAAWRRPALVVYDCVDEEWSFGRLRNVAMLKRLERRLAASADVVLASSHGLSDRLSRLSPRAWTVPNGTDFDHFSQAATFDQARPRDLPASGTPLVGCIGTATARALDYGLLEHALASLHECRFAFVGTADAATARFLARQANAMCLGSRDYAELPRYLAAFDVAIIPYRVGGAIDYVYPKKLHEYLAAGKPVVATDLPELRPFEGTIKIGRTPEGFTQKIAECLAENEDPVLSARLAAARRAVARENTWEKRVDQIVQILGECLRAKGYEGILQAGVASSESGHRKVSHA